MAGGKAPTVAQIAQQVCSESVAVLEDITQLRDSDPIDEYLWRHYGKQWFNDDEHRGRVKRDGLRLGRQPAWWLHG